MEDTITAVLRIINEACGAELDPTDTLDDAGLDSIDLVECVMALEEGFEIELADGEITLETEAKEIAALIDRKKA